MCAADVEHVSGEADLDCGDGNIIADITFASYGTPSGTCDKTAVKAAGESFNFATSKRCHSAVSVGVVEATCIGKTKCSVNAHNSQDQSDAQGSAVDRFNDPCRGVRKRLLVEFTCASKDAVKHSTTYSRKEWGCVLGANIIKYKNKSEEECKKMCDDYGTKCKAFEYGMSKANKIYKPRDCQLQSSSKHNGCNGRRYNLDLYTKHNHYASSPTAAPTTAALEAVRSCVPLHARYYNEQHQGKFLWRERCASLTSTTCESSTEWPRGSGGRCSWSDKAYGLGLTNHHLSHWS